MAANNSHPTNGHQIPVTIEANQFNQIKNQIIATKQLSRNLSLSDSNLSLTNQQQNHSEAPSSSSAAGATVALNYNSFIEPVTALRNTIAAHEQHSIVPIPAYSQPRNWCLPSLLPTGLDPYTLKHQRDKLIETKIKWRLNELESFTANLPDHSTINPQEGAEQSHQDPLASSSSTTDFSNQKLRALIEIKSLRLLQKQKDLREEMMTGINQATKLNLVIDRTAVKRPKKLFLRDARYTETIERRQKLDREQKLKQKHLDHISSIQSHSNRFKSAHYESKELLSRFGKSVSKFHVEAEKEEQRRIERLSKERLKALKADDEEAYLKLIDTAKDTRITHLLRQTDQYLENLSHAVLQQQNDAVHRDGQIHVDQDQTGAAIDESAFGAAPVFDDDRAAANQVATSTEGSKADYYNVAHRIKEEVTKQSSLLTGGQLKEYQIKGLQWMVSLYNNRLNGILADEMGLGKTIQTISLITWLMENKKQPGPYLVIVPLSTLPNWTLEFEKWAPTVKVVVYKGSPNVRKQLQAQIRQGQFEVLLTTYEYIIKDRPMLCKIKWVHMIIDEGHRMKNSQSKLSLTLTTHYQSRYRLILTGTPLQNNLPELWALLNFVLPRVFNSVKSFDEWFNTPFANTGGQDKIELNEEEAILVIRRLHKVLRPFLLRRLKKDVESELPDKVERVIKCKMSGLQLKLTNQMKVHKMIWTDVDNATNTAKGSSGTGGVMRGLQNVIMQLKKICNHPFTFEEVERTINGPDKPTNDTLWRAAGKFELLDRVLPKLFRTGHRVLMFFQMTQVMDIFQDYCSYRGIRNLRLDGMTKPEERAELLKTFNHPECGIDLFILSTRAGGLGLNLQTADTVIIFDSDWNPHQDLQAQDRAHRIGQKKEVRVLRLITSKSVEEHIMSKAQFKLDMDKKVIQAGRFDHKSSAEERETFLRELLEDDDNEEEGDNELGDEELNEMLKRSDEEFEIFTEMDRERAAEAAQQWSMTPEGQAGKPLPERLMTVEELPTVYSKDIAPIVFDPNAAEEEEEGGGRKARNRNAVHYDDGLTEEQFLEAVENEEDLTEVIAKKRGKRAMRQANKMKKRGANESGDEDPEEEEEDEDEEDDDFVGNGRGNGRTSKLSRANSSTNHFSHSPEPNRKRKRILGGSQVGIDDSVDGDSERGIRKPLSNKKRKNNAHGNGEDDALLNSYRKVMRECYDALMKPIAPDSGERRINLFMDLVNRKQFVDYYQIIKKPISMRQINKHITSKYKTLKQFKDDVYLMLNNARIYNETGSYVYLQADALQDYFDHVFQCLVDENGKPRDEPLPQRPPNPDGDSQDSSSGSESNHDDQTIEQQPLPQHHLPPQHQHQQQQSQQHLAQQQQLAQLHQQQLQQQMHHQMHHQMQQQMHQHQHPGQY
ncbi:hypothetical protein PTTG_03431 [Puccinia triticina 1-1 BBBD Race 1]|uniref:ATP-dependent helicase STH1/SNF2 n=2 Tax=Puccinia triticina TaxID=208348 RepID=A0A180GTR9_PUCT1|nr:hypothetical protein PTTG_03431 [Puccinia triticina 1-1 BBBD Race 1]